jgi:SAM-dependent methyltransferase
LVAIDVGCGDGTEALALLARGWTVIAVDAAPEAIARLCAPVAPEDGTRLTALVASFGELELPDADLVYAGLSLPSCDPRDFDQVWRRISTAVRAEGAFTQSAPRPVADPVAGARPEAGGTVARVGELTAVEREAAAADALGEPEFEALELGDALVDPRAPGGGQA